MDCNTECKHFTWNEDKSTILIQTKICCKIYTTRRSPKRDHNSSIQTGVEWGHACPSFGQYVQPECPTMGEVTFSLYVGGGWESMWRQKKKRVSSAFLYSASFPLCLRRSRVIDKGRGVRWVVGFILQLGLSHYRSSLSHVKIYSFPFMHSSREMTMLVFFILLAVMHGWGVLVNRCSR